jgi:hypothetical protein
MRKFLGVCLAFAFAAYFAAVSRPVDAALLYGADGATGALSNLLILDASNGAVISTVGPIGFAVTGLAFDPLTGMLYGSTSRRQGSVQTPGALIRIDVNTGAGTLVGPYGIGTETMADISFRSNGTLYGWLEPNADDLHTINKLTGAATLIGEAGISTAGSGLAFNSSDTLYFTGEGAVGVPLRTVDPDTGLTTVAATLSGYTGDGSFINALAFSDADLLYGVAGGARGPTDLIIIDTTNGAITTLGPTAPNLDAIAFAFTPSGVVSEPPTYALVLVGIGLLGWLGARRRIP